MAALCFALACLFPAIASAAGECRSRPRPPVTLKGAEPWGLCKFDLATLSFAGDAAQQARCLLTPVRKGGHLGTRPERLPDALEHFVGTARDLPSRERLRVVLRQRGLEATFEPSLEKPVAHAQDNDPLARSATYFVLHDTSTPNFGRKPWPGDIDTDPGINRLQRYACSNNIEAAHVFINRSGAIFHPHDFGVAWRATKFEGASNFGHALRGLFLHAELIQPRKHEPGYRRLNDFQAPVPGFSAAQYDALALVYAVASRRAGFWMIPAFHAPIDEGIPDRHDDPQNFELERFADAIERLRAQLAAAR